jgi:hypothetical protein
MSLPNQQRSPLTPDERVAQAYQHRPGRLLALAQATGNKALCALAIDLLRGRKPAVRRR